MYASKENARKAHRTVARWIASYGPFNQEEVDQISDFLVAAEHKLPSEAAFIREEKRRSGTRKTGKVNA